MKLAVFVLALGVAAYAQLARPPYAITNAKVVAGTRTLDSATILVRNGLIEAVGREIALPADARVLDAKGLTVYPGLIDAATHYGFPAAPRGAPAAAPPAGEDIAAPYRYLRPEPVGVNADFTAVTRISSPLPADPRRNLGFTTVLAIPRDGQWQGTSALVNLATGPAGEAVVLPTVAMHVSFRPAGGPRRYPTSLMGVLAVLRQSLIRAQQYIDATRLYDQNGKRGLARPTFDPVSAALIPVLEAAIPVVFAADSAEEIRRALRFSDEFRLRPVILGGAEAWRVAETLKSRSVPVLVSLQFAPPSAAQSFLQSGAANFDPPANSPDRIAAEANPGKLEKAGVRFALVTAASDRPEQFRDKLRVAISRGLSRDGALAALTVAPAEILGAGSQLGSIEAGKIANLTLVEGDLLAPRTRVRALFIDGRLYHPTSPSRDTRRPEPVATAQAGTPPTTPDDPTPVTPRAAATDTAASTIPSRRPPNPEPAPQDLVIRNATILTVTKGNIENGAIWVHDGKIREVGKAVNAPAGAKVIDGSGRFVMPGIIDSHSHSAIRGGVNESGPSVTAQTRVEDVLDPEDINLYRAAAGGVTTLNILHGSANSIGGQNAVIKIKWGRSLEEMLFPGAPRGIKMALGENPKRATSPNTRFPATRMGVENVIRESFRAAREYARAWDDYQGRTAKGEKLIAPERNLTLEALADVLAGKILVHAHCYRADEISMLLDLADEFGFKIRSLQHVLEGYKVAEKIRKHGAGASTFADFWGYKMEAFDGTAYNMAMLVKAGVRTAVNSDSDERARRLYHEAAKAIKYGGVTEEQALRLITTEPAWMLGVEKRVGAIEPGMDADLAVFNAHPFSAYARVEMTLVDGQVVFDRERDLKHRVPWKEEFEPVTPVLRDTEEELH